MKKKFLLSTVLAAVAVASVPFSAQGAAEKPIRVFLEGGSQVEFKVDPVIQNGRTLVQFRPIFEKLGLDITWDQATRTVTGKGEGLEIILQIDNKTALVNGKKIQLDVAPQIMKDNTFVPLRFVGEAAGLDVSWDSYDRSILIAPVEYQLGWVIGKNVEYSKLEDMAGVLSTINETIPELYLGTKQSNAQLFAAFDLDYTIHNIEVLEVKGDQAAVRLELESKKIAGPEFQNNITGTVQYLSKVNGAWKLDSGSVQWVDYLLDDQFQDKKPTVADADKSELKETLSKMIEAMEKEDFDTVKTFYDKGYPNLDMVLESAKQIFALADFKYELKDLRYIDAKDDTVTIRYTIVGEKTSGHEQIPSMTIDAAEVWKKTSEGWKVVSSTNLFVEYH